MNNGVNIFLKLEWLKSLVFKHRKIVY